MFQMNNGLPGPSTTDTVTGGKTLELSEYDKIRKSHKTINDGTKIKMSTRTLSTELCCPICLDLLTNTMTTKECLHRFCSECITTALMRGNKECPTCRKKIISKRSLRPDPNFDSLINKIWPDRKQYERMQEASLKLFQEQSNVGALQKSIEAGMKAQAANRRMRVQGSYDYEKKKRRTTRLECNGGIPVPQNIVSSSSNIDEDTGIAIIQTIHSNTKHLRNSRSTASDNESDVSGTSISTDSSELSESSETCSLGASEDNSTVSSNSVHDALARPRKQQQIQNRIKPPSLYCTLNDKMYKWLSENEDCSSPLREDIDDVIPHFRIIDTKFEDMRKGGEEIEVEFVPTKSLCKRFKDNTGSCSMVICSRYLKATPGIKMVYFAEYLRTSISDTSASNCSYLENVELRTGEHNIRSDWENIDDNNCLRNFPRPEYFYILDHNDQVRKIFLYETLYSAFITSAVLENHLQIFFDILPPDVNNGTKLVSEIINDDLLLKYIAKCGKENEK